MAEPRVTGTFADSIEQLPDLAPVKATEVDLAPAPSLGETYTAARQVGRNDRTDFETIMVRDGYAPILEALELDQSENPSNFYDRDVMGTGGDPVLMGSKLAARRQGDTVLGRLKSMVDRPRQEALIAEEIRERRRKDPKFLPGVPDTVEGLRAYFAEEEKKKRAPAQATLERSEGLTGLLASFAGAAVEGFHDPFTQITLPVGGGGKTILGIAARETLINGVLELAVQPQIADNREIVGEELTAGEVVANVAIAGIAGGVLESGLHLGGRALSPVAKRAADKIEQIRATRSIAGAQLEPVDLFAELDNRELAALTRELVGEDKLTPDERAAIATLEREQEIGEASPFVDNPAGNARHDERLSDAINDLIENRRPREFPVSPSTDAGAARNAPERPPVGTSTPAARPQVSGEAAIAAYKAKNRTAESGGNDRADNPRSSAQGRYQITDGTWKAYHRRLFGSDGLEHKFDPAKQEAIMDAITRDSANKLGAIGEAVTEGNLYLLHFAGEAGGAKILKADPSTPIERILEPRAIAANPFLKGKSASEVVAWAHKKMGGSAASIPPRGLAGELAVDAADPRIAQLRKEALELDDQIVGMTRLADGSPVNLLTRSVPASAIGVDATRFQFKGGGDEFGVTDRLQGVKEWDAGLAGRVTLWEDEAGKLWIADGHQRHGLARRISSESGADIRLDAMVLRSADGISAEEARVWAALKNIAEGTGTTVDAAKVLRDAGAGALDRLPPKSPLVRDGAALSRLSDDAFGAVYNERIPADQAAVIGHLLPDNPDAHLGMVDLLIKVDPANRSQAHSIVRQAIAAGFHKEEQIDLFGSSSSVASLFLEKAKILERGLARLRKMRLVHKTAANEADELEAKGSKIARAQSEKEAQANAEAVAIIDRLAYRAGPVSEALGDAARELAGGARLGDAADRFVTRIRELDLRALNSADDGDRLAIDGAGRESDGGEADPSLFEEPSDQGQPSLIELEAATERFSDPDGPAIKQQADSLEHDFKSVHLFDEKELTEIKAAIDYVDPASPATFANVETAKLPDGRFTVSWSYNSGYGSTGLQFNRVAFATREEAEAWGKDELATALNNYDLNAAAEPNSYAERANHRLQHLKDWAARELPAGKSKADLQTEFEIDRNSHHAVALAGLVDGGAGGELGGFQWRRKSDANGEFIRVWRNGHEGEAIDADADFLLTRGVEQATSGKIEPQLEAEIGRVVTLARSASMDRLPVNDPDPQGLFDELGAKDIGGEGVDVTIGDATMTLRAKRTGSVELLMIRGGGDGSGSAAMKRLVDAADKHGVELELFAKGFDQVPTNKLIEWYERFGFKNLEGRVPTAEDMADPEHLGVDMAREPRAAANDASPAPVLHADQPAADLDPAHPVTGEPLSVAIERAVELHKSFAPIAEGEAPGTHNLANSAPAPDGRTRGEVRAEILDQILAKPATVGHEAHLVLGPPAAGKSTLADPLAAAVGARIIDSDDAKAMLPEFENGIGAGAVHEESARIAEAAAEASIANGDNILLPLVGKTYANVAARIEGLANAGYRVYVHLVDLPIDQAVNRAKSRFAQTGRLVDPAYIQNVGSAPLETYSRIIADYGDKLGGHIHVSNDVPQGSAPKLIDASDRELAIGLGLDGRSGVRADAEIEGGQSGRLGEGSAREGVSSLDLFGSGAPSAVDPGQLARDRQLIQLGAAAPLRAAGDVDQRGEIGLGLFDATNQGKISFRFDEDGAELSAEDLLAELAADSKAIETLRGCL